MNYSPSFATWLPPEEGETEQSETKGLDTNNGNLGVEKPVEDVNHVRLSNLRVFTGTWNVGDRVPPYEHLKSWFRRGLHSDESGELPYDIMAVGCQECYYKPREGYESCEKDWAAAIEEAVGNDFELVSATSLRDSIRLLLFVRGSLLHEVHSIRSNTYSTTIPMFWRKGGIGVQMSYLSTNLIFISCHLAAQASQTSHRNHDVEDILKTLGLGNPNYDVGHQFHHCFVMGDLNYRVDGKTRDEVLSLVQAKQWSELLEHDQLRREQAAGNVMYGFHEPQLAFAPTFKVLRGTRDDYDCLRIPSWCDRILVHSLPGCTATPLAYDSIGTILTSDHVPVFAIWNVTVPIIKLHYRNSSAVRAFLTTSTRSMSPFATNQAPPGSPRSLSLSQTIVQSPKHFFSPKATPQPLVPPIIDVAAVARVTAPSFQLSPEAALDTREWMACTEVIDPEALIYNILLSDVVADLAPISLIRGHPPLDVLPRLVLSSAVMNIEPIKSNTIHEPASQYRWPSVPSVTSRLITEPAMSHHHLFIAIYHCWEEGAETLLAHGVVSLGNHLSQASLFEVPLMYCGLRRGTLSGLLGLAAQPKQASESDTHTDTLEKK